MRSLRRLRPRSSSRALFSPGAQGARAAEAGIAPPPARHPPHATAASAYPTTNGGTGGGSPPTRTGFRSSNGDDMGVPPGSALVPHASAFRMGSSDAAHRAGSDGARVGGAAAGTTSPHEAERLRHVASSRIHSGELGDAVDTDGGGANTGTAGGGEFFAERIEGGDIGLVHHGEVHGLGHRLFEAISDGATHAAEGDAGGVGTGGELHGRCGWRR